MNNAENDFYIGGVSCSMLAKKAGTPLQVYDEGGIRDRARKFRESFTSTMFETKVLYASKAFLCKAMADVIKEEGLGLDVVSGGEIHCAGVAAFNMNDVFFHGNNKSDDEIAYALQYGVGGIIADNCCELERLIAISDRLDRKCDVLIRINPGIKAHTHKYIMTGHADSKFGISIEDFDTICAMIRKIQNSRSLTFKGFHAHIGSQIFEPEAFRKEISVMSGLAAKTEQLADTEVQALDLGGGFGISYTQEDNPPTIEHVCRVIIEETEKAVVQHRLHLKTVMIEPGRGIVGEAGYTLYTAGDSKKTETKKYIFTDGGMADNIRPALYGAKYHCRNISKPDDAVQHSYTVAGKCCESGDILIDEVMLPETERGDILLIESTGAYGVSMASNYNRLPKLPVVFAKDGQARLVVRRQRYEDMMAQECCETL